MMPEQHRLPGTAGQPEVERSPQNGQCHVRGASASARHATCRPTGRGGSVSCSLAGAQANLSPVAREGGAGSPWGAR